MVTLTPTRRDQGHAPGSGWMLWWHHPPLGRPRFPPPAWVSLHGEPAHCQEDPGSHLWLGLANAGTPTLPGKLGVPPLYWPATTATLPSAERAKGPVPSLGPHPLPPCHPVRGSLPGLVLSKRGPCPLWESSKDLSWFGLAWPFGSLAPTGGPRFQPWLELDSAVSPPPTGKSQGPIPSLYWPVWNTCTLPRGPGFLPLA